VAWAYSLTFALDAGSVALSDVAGFSCTYGKRAESASYSAGVATVELFNNDGKFTPGGGGTFSDEEWVGKAFRLFVSDSAKSYTYGPPTVFAGVVEDIDLKIMSTKESRLTVRIIDRLGQLSQMMLGDPDDSGGIAFTGANVSEQLDEIMDYQSVGQHGDEWVVVDLTNVGRTTQTGLKHEGSAGKLAQLLGQTDGGDVFCRQGRMLDANYQFNNLCFRPQGTPSFKVAFGGFDDAGAGGTYLFRNLDVLVGGETVWTMAQFERQGGDEQTVKAAASLISDYGLRGLRRTGLLNDTDADTASMATAWVAQHQKPSVHVSQITTQPLRPGDGNDPLFDLSIMDLATVKYTTPGAGSQQTYEGVIIGVKWAITPDAAVGTFSLAKGDDLAAFILNSALYGVLDTNRLN
jgi:hypothetical protein